MIDMRKPQPARRGGARGGLGPRLAMFGLALLGLVGFEGCQSGCGSCGLTQRVTGFTQRVGQGFSNLGARVFHPGRYMGSECCDSGAVVVDPGVPAGAIVPGPVIQAPIDGAASPELAPATPGATSKPSGTGTQGSLRSNPASGNAKMSYETERPVSDGPGLRSGRNNMARAILPRTDRTVSGASQDSNPLDHLPPVELPSDVARRATSAPVPLEADALTPPASNRAEAKPEKKPVSPTASPSTNSASSASAAAPPSASLILPNPKPALEANVSPGLARFTAVGPSVAGGSVPSKEGLDWLKEKGYRTLIDLRERKDVNAAFIDDVVNHGFRYVALPVGDNRLDDVKVRQFRDELARTDARPLFFCDSDGSRAALCWYVYRITEGGVESSIARREAEEIMPLSESLVAIATKYIATRTTDVQKTKKADLVGPPPLDREAMLPVGAIVVKAADAESRSLLGRSAVFTFTGFNDQAGSAIPAPRSLARSRMRPAVNEASRSADGL